MSSESSELGGSNKLGKWFLIILLGIGIPSLILSQWSLEKLQGVVNDNSAPEKLKEKAWTADLQKWIAHAYNYSLRPEHAVEKYQWAGDLYSRLQNFDAAGWMYYDQGLALEDSGKYENKGRALEIYEKLADEYKEYPVGAKASAAAIRIKTYGRP